MNIFSISSSDAVMPVPTAMIEGPLDRPVVWSSDGCVDVKTFLSHVRGIEAILPFGKYVINLCEDRYRFLLVFYACALRGQITLLPSSRVASVIAHVQGLYSDSFCVGDGFSNVEGLSAIWRVPDPLPCADGPWPQLEESAVVAIGFTSGSTGAPTAHAKTWRDLRQCALFDHATLQSLLSANHRLAVVATIPAQHMYGIEMSVLMPVVTQSSVHAARPFFPEDIAKTLAMVPEPRILVTTPIHLKVLVASNVTLPALTGIVSATAALAPDLAKAAQERFQAPVCEFFGSTETLVFAWRQPVFDSRWTPMPGVKVIAQPNMTLIDRSHLAQPVEIADIVTLHDDGRFTLQGRAADLIEIAGKRASLADLNQRLLAIPGVQDGVIIQMLAANSEGVGRIAAVVVAPSLTQADILRALRRHVDPAFMPRRLRFVEELPRSSVGKISREMILALLRPE